MKTPIIHSVSAVFIFKEKIFAVQRQSYLKAFPGYHAFPGGKIELNESSEPFKTKFLCKHDPIHMRALNREINEELEYDLEEGIKSDEVLSINEFAEVLAPEFSQKRFRTWFYRIDLKKKINCAGRSIGEYDDKIPSDLTAEQILIRSGNIGSVRIGQKIGIEKFKLFLENIGILNKIEFDIEEVGQPIPFRWGKCKLATASFGHGITTTPLQLVKGYSIITNGGYDIRPTLIKSNLNKKEDRKRLLKKGISEKINPILRKIVSTKEGTAEFANVSGYEVGGKTGTAQKSINGIYSNNKVNTFVAIFPTSKPKYILIVLLDEPKPNKEYIYYYRDGRSPYKGNWRNTAGWTSVEIAGKIIEKIGPILATKYEELN